MKLSDRPIFIVGSPRSGTTLMRSIVDAHPSIFCPHWETGVFVYLDMIVNRDVKKILEKEKNFPLSRPDLVAWVRHSTENLIERFAVEADKPRWAEKTPAHVFHMDLIHEAFPRAQFIHMIRNGRDVVRSLQNMAFAPRKIRWSSQRWVDSVRAGRAFAKQLPPELYCEVRYEELISEPRPVVERLCGFLGEPFTPQMLEFHKPENTTWGKRSQPSSDKPGEKLNEEYDFGRAAVKPIVPLQNKPINEYRELGLFERAIFNWIASPLQKELNYK